MISGVKVMELRKNADERGYFVETLREDWKEFLEGDRPAQQSLSLTKPGTVRAWHRHIRGQNDYLMCAEGTIKLCVFDDREGSMTRGELDEFFLDSSQRLQVARIVGSCWHGYKALGDRPAMILYSVTKLYDYKDPDEERRSWDDPSVVPTSINGSTADPRVGKSYRWHS